jgi:hypothetical protein
MILETPMKRQAPSPHFDTSALPLVREEMLRFFAEDSYPPIEVSEADVVSVTMDARFQVRTVSLYGMQSSEDVARLEQAIVVAMNKAIGEVTRRNAERLALALAQANN